jgi:hypothetical protein
VAGAVGIGVAGTVVAGTVVAGTVAGGTGTGAVPDGAGALSVGAGAGEFLASSSFKRRASSRTLSGFSIQQNWTMKS